MLNQKFTIFVNKSLKVLFILILIGSIRNSISNFITLSNSNMLDLLIVNSCLFLMSIALGYYIYKNYQAQNAKKYLIIIVGFAFLLRLCWILLVATPPSSDFRVIYESGKNFIRGNYYAFRGTNYIARFPHLTVLSLYLGLMQKLFKDGLFAIKLVNIILSTLNVYLLYLLGTKIYENSRKGIGISLIAALFPPYIMYNAVTCSENIAMTFFILSTYIFLMIVKGKRNSNWMLLAGFLLSLGNLFRMVGYVILIAYMVYLMIYAGNIKRIRNVVCLILAFFLPFYMADTILLKSGITEYHLWKGSEPNITSVLKGTNVEAYGGWTKEDALLPDKYNNDYEATEKAAKEIIKQRLTQTPINKLFNFI